MKLIHTSDLHLDSPLTARLSPADARERRRELVASFRRMIDEAESVGAVGIIIAGDLFDNDRVGIKNLEAVMGIIENARRLVFFYLTGNHEKNRLLSSGVRIPENLKLFESDWTYYDFENITIAGRCELSEDSLRTLSLNSDRINILVLHGELADKCDPAGKISARELAELPVDYVALGHYHTYSEHKLTDRTTAVYSGTPEGRGFDETGDKGFVIIDTDTGRASHKFLKRASRTLHIREVNISGAEREIEIENRVAAAISGIPSCDLVRVVLTGEHEPELRRDTDSLTERFSPSFFFLEVKDESRLKISVDSYKNDKSLKGEFIRLVLEKKGLSDGERAAIIECGIRALNGESI